MWHFNIPSNYFVVEKQLSEQEAECELELEVQKPACERDIPHIQRLFRHTFTFRRNALAAFADGSVKELVGKFPLLSDSEYVRHYVL